MLTQKFWVSDDMDRDIWFHFNFGIKSLLKSFGLFAVCIIRQGMCKCCKLSQTELLRTLARVDPQCFDLFAIKQ